MKIALCMLALPIIIGGILLLERGHRRCAVAALAGSLLLLGIAGGQPW